MKYAIIGSGKIGTAIAKLFARENIEVYIANSRGPETLASLVEELGAKIRPTSVQEASNAEVIFLAVPFSAHTEVAKLLEHWEGKVIIDAMNAFGVAPEELGGLLSSELVSKHFVGARLVKAFNHLPAGQLGSNPRVDGQRQVIFLSSNDVEASASISELATQLGFAPIQVGSLHQGGLPLHVFGKVRGGLLLQNLVKLG